ncbi:hypothetical protein [Lapillicoccus sp.]|uniref:hypothetical protein n=1 Tax=Lapillicoccus sp. TaxID=1909287 RepID=UPI0039836DA0
MPNEDLIRTRHALHAVAEHVLAGPQHRSSRTIELRVSPGGFRTVSKPSLAVVGTDLLRAGIAHPLSGTTARDLAASVGIEAGAPVDVYGDGGQVSADEPLDVDAQAARVIADAFAHGDAALRLLAPDLEPVLWPEHFDVGIRLDNINYGVSPGDGYLGEPYAYVGVDVVPADDPYWNAPFGTVQPMTSFADVSELRDFFTDARQHRRN